jgi:hypothetical protein
MGLRDNISHVDFGGLIHTYITTMDINPLKKKIIPR